LNAEKQGAAAHEYRFNQEPSGKNTNSLFICLEFSGGGTRAAALSYGVLELLQRTTITWKGIEKSLLDEVDCISSVSGGSFTAAYYGLFGNRLFTDFRTRFLEANVQAELLWRLFVPTNWLRLASPYFSRIDLAAEYYDEALFEKESFATLASGPRRPFVILNATNLANGERFEFTQEQFDFLQSDLSTYSIARAVAASSAFPFLLSPISLRNYPHSNFKLPADYAMGLQNYELNRRHYYWAKNRTMYMDDKELPYVHLMDGGLADNIGLRPIESVYRRTSGFVRKLINDGQIEKFVVLVVNARTTEDDTISKRESPPELTTVAFKTATVAMEHYSIETIEVMKQLREERLKAQKSIAACQKKLDQCPQVPKLPTMAMDLDPYVIEVNFEAIQDVDRKKYFLRLPTSFSLQKDEVEALINIGPELLRNSPEFIQFMKSLTEAQ
jgi:predicted acylesterase/phospholipase RssA